MIWDIKFNYIMLIDKKCEFCKCTHYKTKLL